MENHSLIERIKGKDTDRGLKEVYDKYRDEFVIWAVKHHKCSTEEAKDVFQQTVVIFYENIIYEKVTEISTRIKTYLFSIGKNKILELLRRKSKNLPHLDEQTIASNDLYINVFDEEYEEKLLNVEESLNMLGDPCKNILEQYYYLKKSMAEISELLQYKNSDTVKNMKYKCLQRLKQIYKSGFAVIN
jgi:RNA polymerase sigma factor (sigma-70 family)